MEESALPHTQAGYIDKAKMDFLLSQPLIAHLATVGGDQPHVAPVWFLWDGESLWIETDQSFRKARNLRRNPKCAVSIDATLGGLRFWGILMLGTAELISEPHERVLELAGRVYTKYLGVEGVLAPTPQAMLIQGDHVIIRLKPDKVITWDDTHSAIAPIG